MEDDLSLLRHPDEVDGVAGADVRVLVAEEVEDVGDLAKLLVPLSRFLPAGGDRVDYAVHRLLHPAVYAAWELQFNLGDPRVVEKVLGHLDLVLPAQLFE